MDKERLSPGHYKFTIIFLFLDLKTHQIYVEIYLCVSLCSWYQRRKMTKILYPSETYNTIEKTSKTIIKFQHCIM